MSKLDGKVAIVTGASGGLGRAIALALAGEGAAIAVHYRKNRDAAGEVVRAIEQQGGSARSVQANVGAAAEAQRLIQETIEALGGVHILVNNAGITRDTLVLRMKEEDWLEVLNTNLTGAFFCTKAVLREFLRQRSGRIINITSVAGQIGTAGQANYAAAKAGLIGMTKAIAREVASRGITVNAVAPGFIDAGITRQLPPDVARSYIEQVPLGRAGKSDEVAAAVVFLASEDAAYITGQVLNVDGGLVMG
ncbi:MAG: 3-oxoacyl-[acyl-carrier-protein] reductase [Armatimonadetes bacterium]|nr:3-oxoacyl-[acyl-carrier-protein] reductase [Armatimonadota bacterium]MBI2202082.1 3-oxoacyl-[acyl-carrier-protein] reductase [Armatimonadota bacterium]MBI2246408.1 3-oxoacyl-[acyl-carrier-protein] reductase [Armatimonadota bacterium]MBI2972706.1 3-oxoacyl-[acyl-carrier-protein] reductase [Armatimonadota bacterium]